MIHAGMISRIRTFALSMVALQNLMTWEATAIGSPRAESEIGNFLLKTAWRWLHTGSPGADFTQMVWYKVGNADEPPGRPEGAKPNDASRSHEAV